MIFQHTWQKVLSGQKTQTRRLARDSDRLWTAQVEDKAPEKVLWRGDRAKWRTGRSFTPEQRQWLDKIAETIGLNLGFGEADFMDYFHDEGGLLAARSLCDRETLPELLNELIFSTVSEYRLMQPKETKGLKENLSPNYIHILALLGR